MSSLDCSHLLERTLASEGGNQLPWNAWDQFGCLFSAAPAIPVRFLDVRSIFAKECGDTTIPLAQARARRRAGGRGDPGGPGAG